MAVCLRPIAATTFRMSVVAGPARLRRRGGYLVDIHAVGMQFLLYAVNKTGYYAAPQSGSRTSDGIQHLGSGINFGIQRSVRLAARSRSPAECLVAVGIRVPQTAVDIRHRVASPRLHSGNQLVETGLRREIIGIMRVVRIVVPIVPMYEQPFAVEVDRLMHGIDSLLAYALDTNPRIGVEKPLRNAALSQRLITPFGLESERTIPSYSSVTPSLV